MYAMTGNITSVLGITVFVLGGHSAFGNQMETVKRCFFACRFFVCLGSALDWRVCVGRKGISERTLMCPVIVAVVAVVSTMARVACSSFLAVIYRTGSGVRRVRMARRYHGKNPDRPFCFVIFFPRPRGWAKKGLHGPDKRYKKSTLRVIIEGCGRNPEIVDCPETKP